MRIECIYVAMSMYVYIYIQYVCKHLTIPVQQWIPVPNWSIETTKKKDVVPVSHRQMIMFFIATPTTIENRTAEGSNGSQGNSVLCFKHRVVYVVAPILFVLVYKLQSH